MNLRIAERAEGPRRQWQCSMCGKLGVWGHGWQWYGSLKQWEERPESIVVICSDDCRDKFSQGSRR